MLKAGISYGLIFILLIAGLNVPVYAHTCYLFGVTEKSVYSNDYCCEEIASTPEHHNQTQLELTCCGLDIKTYKADLQTDHSQNNQIQLFAPVSFLTELVWEPAVSTAIDSDLYQRPPPALLFNRTLHHFIQVYRL